MPVSVLLVEGELDMEVLNPIVGTLPMRPTLERGGSKGSLGPKTHDRRKTTPTACYLRDRDFDYDPPSDLSQPTVDANDKTPNRIGPETLGFRWCRHSIENYLLEPRLVAAATNWPEGDFSASLLAAAQHIVHYTAARWAVGIVRRSLPPSRELSNRPDLKNEIKIPTDCSQKWCFDWAEAHVEDFRKNVDAKLSTQTVQTLLAERSQRVDSLTTVHEVLLWHSGKDLLAALATCIANRPEGNPVVFVRTIRDWIRDRPENCNDALQMIPEWQGLLNCLQGA